MSECELWVCLDANGDYAAGSTDEAARNQYESDVGELAACDGFRLFKLVLTLPTPAVAELAGRVAEGTAGPVPLTVT
jgi:hypothetical protein